MLLSEQQAVEALGDVAVAEEPAELALLVRGLEARVLGTLLPGPGLRHDPHSNHPRHAMREE